MAELKPCPVCRARLKQKRTVRGETVFDHPKNGCANRDNRIKHFLRRQKKNCGRRLSLGTCSKRGGRRQVTHEEAIKVLEYPVRKWSMEWSDRDDGLSYTEALDMAISALREQESPCAACGDGGRHLDAPPCSTICPAHPKLESSRTESDTLKGGGIDSLEV